MSEQTIDRIASQARKLLDELGPSDDTRFASAHSAWIADARAVLSRAGHGDFSLKAIESTKHSRPHCCMIYQTLSRSQGTMSPSQYGLKSEI